MDALPRHSGALPTLLGTLPPAEPDTFFQLFSGVSSVKNPPANTGDPGSVHGSGRSPGVGNGNPLQYSCLENPMNRGAWWATVHRLAKELDMTE